MRSLKLAVLVWIALVLCHASGRAAEILVDVDAGSFGLGGVTEVKNSGSLGGAFSGAVEVASVDGRKALVFSGTQQLASSFSLPGFGGDKPFTVEIWAQNAAIDRLETMLFCSTGKGMGVEFNFGRSSNSGAFRSGFKATAAYSRLPSGSSWNHLAWSYSGGRDRSLSIYVNGELECVRNFAVTALNPCQLSLGAIGTSDRKPLRQPFSGALARLRIHAGALAQADVRRSGGFQHAFNPVPKEGVVTGALSVKLQWDAGTPDAAEFAIFAGTDKAAVERRDESARAGRQPAQMRETGPLALKLGAVHYWVVDQIDSAGKTAWPGVVWSFTADPGLASEPRPQTRNSNVPVTLRELTWRPGSYATKQHVYFGTEQSLVAGSDTPTVANLPASAGRCEIPAELKPGTQYFWRVDSENGEHAPARGAVWTFRTQDVHVPNDITFFVSSDTHYGRENNGELNRMVIDVMNALPGTPLPKSLGEGAVRTPRGVVLNGDLLDEGYDKEHAPRFWREFCDDYGLAGGDGRLAFPVYEGFGNHDGGPARSIPRVGIKERNAKRVGLKSISENGLHYSWDWDHLHLVQLNLFGGVGPEDVQNVNKAEHDPADALGFLKKDLAENVGASGRLVIVFQHFGWLGGMSDWWTPLAKERFYDAVKSYNVACLINGHSHGAAFIPWKDVLTIHNGATARPEGGTGDFLVVRVAGNELTVIQRKLGDWGVSTKKSLVFTPAREAQ